MIRFFKLLFLGIAVVSIAFIGVMLSILTANAFDLEFLDAKCNELIDRMETL